MMFAECFPTGEIREVKLSLFPDIIDFFPVSETCRINDFTELMKRELPVIFSVFQITELCPKFVFISLF